jgi:glucose dehydrogenase
VKTTPLSAIARLAKPDRTSANPHVSETDGDYVRKGKTNDKATGVDLWTYPLRRRTSGRPITYSVDGKQFLVISTGSGADAALIAIGL